MGEDGPLSPVHQVTSLHKPKDARKIQQLDPVFTLGDLRRNGVISSRDALRSSLAYPGLSPNFLNEPLEGVLSDLEDEDGDPGGGAGSGGEGDEGASGRLSAAASAAARRAGGRGASPDQSGDPQPFNATAAARATLLHEKPAVVERMEKGVAACAVLRDNRHFRLNSLGVFQPGVNDVRARSMHRVELHKHLSTVNLRAPQPDKEVRSALQQDSVGARLERMYNRVLRAGPGAGGAGAGAASGGGGFAAAYGGGFGGVGEESLLGASGPWGGMQGTMSSLGAGTLDRGGGGAGPAGRLPLGNAGALAAGGGPGRSGLPGGGAGGGGGGNAARKLVFSNGGVAGGGVGGGHPAAAAAEGRSGQGPPPGYGPGPGPGPGSEAHQRHGSPRTGAKAVQVPAAAAGHTRGGVGGAASGGGGGADTSAPASPARPALTSAPSMGRHGSPAAAAAAAGAATGAGAAPGQASGSSHISHTASHHHQQQQQQQQHTGGGGAGGAGSGVRPQSPPSGPHGVQQLPLQGMSPTGSPAPAPAQREREREREREAGQGTSQGQGQGQGGPQNSRGTARSADYWMRVTLPPEVIEAQLRHLAATTEAHLRAYHERVAAAQDALLSESGLGASALLMAPEQVEQALKVKLGQIQEDSDTNYNYSSLSREAVLSSRLSAASKSLLTATTLPVFIRAALEHVADHTGELATLRGPRPDRPVEEKAGEPRARRRGTIDPSTSRNRGSGDDDADGAAAAGRPKLEPTPTQRWRPPGMALLSGQQPAAAAAAAAAAALSRGGTVSGPRRPEAEVTDEWLDAFREEMQAIERSSPDTPPDCVLPLPALPGGDMDAGAYVRARLERLWGLLEMPPATRLDMVLYFTSRERALSFGCSLALWEQAAEAVVSREAQVEALVSVQREVEAGQAARLSLGGVAALCGRVLALTRWVGVLAGRLAADSGWVLTRGGAVYPGEDAIGVAHLLAFMGQLRDATEETGLRP